MLSEITCLNSNIKRKVVLQPLHSHARFQSPPAWKRGSKQDRCTWRSEEGSLRDTSQVSPFLTSPMLETQRGTEVWVRDTIWAVIEAEGDTNIALQNVQVRMRLGNNTRKDWQGSVQTIAHSVLAESRTRPHMYTCENCWVNTQITTS